jgi:hypothetical protein
VLTGFWRSSPLDPMTHQCHDPPTSCFRCMSALGFSPSDLVFAWEWGEEGYAGKTNAEQLAALAVGQSAFFITLVICQLGNLLSTRRRRLPYFYTPKAPALPTYNRGRGATEDDGFMHVGPPARKTR